MLFYIYGKLINAGRIEGETWKGYHASMCPHRVGLAVFTPEM